MKQKFKDQIKGILIVPLGLSIVLIPFSMIIGWNLVTLILFWFLIIPALTLYLPAKVSGNRNHVWVSLLGLIIFYAIMVFMIYDHYETDYFQVMILSGIINLFVVTAISLKWRLRIRTQ